MVVCLNSDDHAAKGIREPPPLVGNLYTPSYYEEAMDHFIAAVSSSIHTASPLEYSTPTGYWLSALIQVQVVRTIGTLQEMRDPRSRLLLDDEQHLTKLSQVCSHLESARREIMGVQERITNIRRSDYALAFSRFEQLLGDVASRKNNLNERLHNQFRVKSIDAAESTVHESRSAVACESPDFES